LQVSAMIPKSASDNEIRTIPEHFLFSNPPKIPPHYIDITSFAR